MWRGFCTVYAQRIKSLFILRKKKKTSVYMPKCISQTGELCSMLRLKDYWKVNRPLGRKLAVALERWTGCTSYESRSLVVVATLWQGGALWSSWSPPSAWTRPPLGGRGEGRGILPHRPRKRFKSNVRERESERWDAYNEEVVKTDLYEL